jgi:NTE family protein
MLDDTRDLALVFAGGNAVGAYHAGTYEALHGSGLRPDWVVGASIGAVTAAIVAGNAPEDRVAKLRTFWDEATQATGPSPTGLLKPRQVYNGLLALLALAWGRPSIFGHRYPAFGRPSLGCRMTWPCSTTSPCCGPWSASSTSSG